MRQDNEGDYVQRMTGVLWSGGYHVRPTSWLCHPERAHILAAYRYAATELGAASSILADVTPEEACLIWKIIQTGLAVTAADPRRWEIR